MIDVEKALKDPDKLLDIAKTLPGHYVLLHGPTVHIARAVNIVAEAGWKIVSHSVSPRILSPIAYVFMSRDQPEESSMAEESH